MDDTDETEARIRAMLAETAPQHWDEARRRLGIVRRYVAEGDRSIAAVDEYARQAGISRSLFYRLARIYAKGAAPSVRNASKDDADKDVDPTTDLTARAIEFAGPSASGSQVYRTVVELSKAEGIGTPTQRGVRLRTVQMLAGRSIAARMGLTADFAIDRAVLNLDVGVAGSPLPAHLVCMVDLERGRIVRHLLTAGEPTSELVASLAGDDAVRGAPIAISQSDASLFVERVRSAVVETSGRLVIGRWQAGTAIRAAVGLKLGKVALLARIPRSARPMTPVGFDTAGRVIDRLLEPYRLQPGEAADPAPTFPEPGR